MNLFGGSILLLLIIGIVLIECAPSSPSQSPRKTPKKPPQTAEAGKTIRRSKSNEGPANKKPVLTKSKSTGQLDEAKKQTLPINETKKTQKLPIKAPGVSSTKTSKAENKEKIKQNGNGVKNGTAKSETIKTGPQPVNGIGGKKKVVKEIDANSALLQATGHISCPFEKNAKYSKCSSLETQGRCSIQDGYLHAIDNGCNELVYNKKQKKYAIKHNKESGGGHVEKIICCKNKEIKIQEGGKKKSRWVPSNKEAEDEAKKTMDELKLAAVAKGHDFLKKSGKSLPPLKSAHNSPVAQEKSAHDGNFVEHGKVQHGAEAKEDSANYEHGKIAGEELVKHGKVGQEAEHGVVKEGGVERHPGNVVENESAHHQGNVGESVHHHNVVEHGNVQHGKEESANVQEAHDGVVKEESTFYGGNVAEEESAKQENIKTEQLASHGNVLEGDEQGQNDNVFNEESVDHFEEEPKKQENKPMHRGKNGSKKHAKFVEESEESEYGGELVKEEEKPLKTSEGFMRMATRNVWNGTKKVLGTALLAGTLGTAVASGLGMGFNGGGQNGSQLATIQGGSALQSVNPLGGGFAGSQIQHHNGANISGGHGLQGVQGTHFLNTKAAFDAGLTKDGLAKTAKYWEDMENGEHDTFKWSDPDLDDAGLLDSAPAKFSEFESDTGAFEASHADGLSHQHDGVNSIGDSQVAKEIAEGAEALPDSGLDVAHDGGGQVSENGILSDVVDDIGTHDNFEDAADTFVDAPDTLVDTPAALDEPIHSSVQNNKVLAKGAEMSHPRDIASGLKHQSYAGDEFNQE